MYTSEAPPVHEDSPRILVVDDEKIIREIIADFLSMEGFAVRTAEDGDSALLELSRQQYDLVLCDMKMPKMGGLELLEAIRKHTPNIVTIMMTGFGTVESAIDAMKKGAYDYILKPFKVDEVVQVIRRGLEKQKLQAENLRLREALSLYKVSEAIAASLSLDEVMRTVIDAALDEVGADVVLTVLDDGEGAFFERSREFGPNWTGVHNAGEIDIAKMQAELADLPFIRADGPKAVAYFATAPVGNTVSSIIATPLRMRSRVIGILIAVSFSRAKKFDEGQRKLLTMVSDRAAAAIENARLYEDLKATFRQTIRGLASAIDKMDRYTSGHSERVAAYAQILAIKLGLGEEQVEIVRQAALMHDIGKIGCVLNLNKPGKLAQSDYEVFKQHPGFGKDILEPIKFLNPLIPGVHLHHERWDGNGYPLGLEKQGIPLVARIISVADTYDAMTSDRAYRRALPHDVAVTEIDRCCGSQFDPDVGREFVEAIVAHRRDATDRGEKIPE
jgi:response regulator RpfG family c-di-GMP phosphodiesterase